MKVALHQILLVISFVIVQATVKPVKSSLSYENKNFVKIKQDPTRLQMASVYQSKNNNYGTRYNNNVTIPRTTPRDSGIKNNAYLMSHHAPLGIGKNYSQDKNTIVYNNGRVIPKKSQIKKWQVGRVSRKQYEIVNMLWRKTKIFVDMEPTTPNYLLKQNNDTVRSIRHPFIRLPSRPSVSSTTSSYIEFYYLDEADERVKELTQKHRQLSTMRENQIRNHGNHKFVLSDSPMLSFRIFNPIYNRSPFTTRYTQPTNKNKRRKARTRDSSLAGFDFLNSLTPPHKFQRMRTQYNKFVPFPTVSRYPRRNGTINITAMISKSEHSYDNDTCPTTINIEIHNDTKSENNRVNITYKQKSTTAYDKIKFFEMYDKHTLAPYYDKKDKFYEIDNVDIFVKGNELNINDRKVLLEHVDQSIGNMDSKTRKVKHAKKHIIDLYKSESNIHSNANLVLELKVTVKPTKLNISNVAHPPDFVSNVTKQDVTKQPLIKLVKSDSKIPQFLEYRNSNIVNWSEYPFTAVYIYKPSQVHCDAAGISPHWLITSGSCLSRHHKNPGGDGRSAFVTYCGVAWWNPERVAYVKYSLVHPNFHPRDKTRRHLYNIGLIQVVNSMASACSGWSAISLMSHQIVTEGESAIAKAVGWGLDRFDSRYSSNDLPQSVLMSYENQVFSHSCPGNIGYGKAKRLDEEGGIKNVYCLALPPYLSEATDPIHGGLLLVGGKLVALYLQEERRPWGDQCAQYTGTWRLVPWILDVARENDDIDTFTLDI